MKPVEPDFADFLHDESRCTGFAEKILFAKTEDDVRRALRSGLPVIIQDDLSFGTARVFMAAVRTQSKNETYIFRDLDEALQ